VESELAGQEISSLRIFDTADCVTSVMAALSDRNSPQYGIEEYCEAEYPAFGLFSKLEMT